MEGDNRIMEPTQKQELTSKEIVQKITEQLSGTGWDKELRRWWISQEMEDIIDQLKQYTLEGHRWIPGAAKMFKWLQMVPYDKVKCVIMTSNTSTLLEYNTGIPWHIEPLKRGEKEVELKRNIILDCWLHAMGIPEERRFKQLDHWLEQGVLMVPMALTCRVEGMPHHKLWTPFHMRLIEAINKKGDIPVLLTDKTVEYEHYYTSKYVKCISNVVPWKEPDTHKWINESIKAEDGRRKPIKWTL